MKIGSEYIYLGGFDPSTSSVMPDFAKNVTGSLFIVGKSYEIHQWEPPNGISIGAEKWSATSAKSHWWITDEELAKHFVLTPSPEEYKAYLAYRSLDGDFETFLKQYRKVNSL